MGRISEILMDFFLGEMVRQVERDSNSEMQCAGAATVDAMVTGLPFLIYLGCLVGVPSQIERAETTKPLKDQRLSALMVAASLTF